MINIFMNYISSSIVKLYLPISIKVYHNNMSNFISKMQKVILLIFFLLTFTYGIIVGKYEVFPFQVLKMSRHMINPIDNASILNVKSANAQRLFWHFNSKADIAFIGDSITSSGRWSEFFPNIKVVNRGIGGDKSSDILNRLDSILSTQPTKAYIMVGLNDISHDVSVYDILENYSLIVDSLLDANIEVTIQSTIQCELSVCGIERIKSINKLNKILVELAYKKKVSFLSLGELSEQDGLKSKYTTDGSHLSALGYIYWVDMLIPTLRLK
jgi:lysophospholipase L1-like esterase